MKPTFLKIMMNKTANQNLISKKHNKINKRSILNQKSIKF